MRLSNFYLFTKKENPSDAYLVSHKLMVRSGMIKQVATGIYSWLPMGLMVLNKIKEVVVEHHVKSNINEMLMPTIQSADIWKKSGRFNDYGKEMLKIKDRHNNDLLYGPTNEEMITEIISDDLKSYKDLPKLLFHVQWKFRDEVRPRFGIMRCREFLMKDAYSFDLDYDSAFFAYCKMFGLYMKIFNTLGLKVIPVRAESGPIGGALSHEFILESNEGESDIYYDNRLLNISIDKVNLDNKAEIKEYYKAVTNLYSCTSDKHEELNFNKNVPKDNQKLSKGIEVGHIFYFGTKYSELLNANYTNNNGKEALIHSGSYGIGISRLVGAIIEANYDEKGIIWPKEVSPFQIGLINVRNDNQASLNFCESYYKNNATNFKILYDDRNARIGEKLNNMDLLGIPVQIIVGEKNLVNQNLEIKDRQTGKVILVNIEKLQSYLSDNYEF